MKCFVLLPCFNEAENIQPLIREINKTLHAVTTHLTVNKQIYAPDSYEIIACDDGSTDGTLGKLYYLSAKGDVTLLRHEHNLGLAATYRTLIQEALEKADKNDAIIMLDADGTHDPVHIGTMIAMLKSGIDVVVASRYKGKQLGVPLYRRLLSRAVNWLIRHLCNVPVEDCTCGYRCYQAKLLKKILPLISEGFEVSAEVLVKTSRVNPVPKILEIPFTLNYGAKKGASKLRLPHTVKAYLQFLWRNTQLDLTTPIRQLAYDINPRIGKTYDKDPKFWNDGIIALLFLIVSFFIYDAVTAGLPWYLRLLGYVGIAFFMFCIQHFLRRFWIFQK